jgi:long-chain acyl-CoA synthetase
VEKRYKEILDALYSDVDSVHIDTSIKYEDGREARINTDLHIQKVLD